MSIIQNLVEGVFHPKGGWKPEVNYPLVYDRVAPIEGYIKGRSVLDCGCSGEDEEKEIIHSRISALSRRCVGVEIDKTKAMEMQEKGFDVRHGDVHSINLGEKFEVVYAGELLEHLQNPGLFLENMKRHLNENGVLVVTTPNFYFSSMLLRLLFKRDIQINSGHVCWFDVKTLNNMLERNGFQPERIMYYQSSPRILANLLAKLNHRMARGIIVVASKK